MIELDFRKMFLTVAAAALLLGCSKDKTDEGGTEPPPEPPVEIPDGTVNPDLWAATDPLNRSLPEATDNNTRRSNKTVAIFYWTWHCPPMVEYGTVGNISQIKAQNPGAMDKKDDPVWNRGGSNTHFWGEPLFGYYRTTDPWVLRRHAEMLADAGVDAVFFDCTNAPFTWEDSYLVLLKVWDQARREGVKAPKIAFMLPFGPSTAAYGMIEDLYKKVYKASKYPEMWFRWKGKPCIMAYPSCIPTNTTIGLEMLNFFTFRPGQPDYVNGPSDNSQWGWLEIFPQHMYGLNNEQVPVGVAQNTSPDRQGHAGAFNVPGSYSRSYTRNNGFDKREKSYLYGANFQEQWDRALEMDPQLIFVTGWNEYIAGKWDRGTKDGDNWNGYPFSFVDQYDWDHSRDIEPNNEWYDSRGNYEGDTYYYQLIQNVRKYKGLPKKVYASDKKTFEIGQFDGWKEVKPDFAHYKNNIEARAHRGHTTSSLFYSNKSGRNDIIDAKVARDDEYVYFYVATTGAMTLPSAASSPNWMWLLINTDRKYTTGWEGYDYMINFIKPDKSTGTVSSNSGNRWAWNKAGEFEYALKGNQMEIRIKRSVLGLGDKLDFEFKWVDNMPVNDKFNISYFYTYGDAAPGGRFNFVYTEK